MKNTTSQETRFPLPATLRVAFRNQDIVEAKDSKTSKSKKHAEQTRLNHQRHELPMFDDHLIKAKDHDPL